MNKYISDMAIDENNLVGLKVRVELKDSCNYHGMSIYPESMFSLINGKIGIIEKIHKNVIHNIVVQFSGPVKGAKFKADELVIVHE